MDRWAPSDAATPWVEHYWSVTWDRRGHTPFTSAVITVITFPSLHLTHEWGTDSPRHGFALPATLVHGVVERVFTTTLSERGAVIGARFRPGGFAARFGRDAASLTGRTVLADDGLFGVAMRVEDDRDGPSACTDQAIGAYAGPVDSTYVALTALLDRVRDDCALHRVAQVMAQSPWSARTTQRVFRHYVGVPVKWVLCRYRLQRAALEIETVHRSTSPTSPSGLVGTTRRISSTTSGRCWDVRRGNTPRDTGSSPRCSARPIWNELRR